MHPSNLKLFILFSITNSASLKCNNPAGRESAMNSKNVFLFLFFFLFYIADAFNITQFLSQYGDFSTFNDYLTRTQVAADINSRRTITVLVVENGAIGSLSGKSADVLKDIMSVHVVLDYYDIHKLQNLPHKTTLLTTLFQASGKAENQQGFINATDMLGGGVSFGSAANPGDLSASLIKSIAQQPFNLSVLQISNAIVPQGISNSTTNSTSNSPPPPPPPTQSPSPASSPTPGMAPSPSPPSPAPKRSPPKRSPPKRSPVASPPKPSDAPAPSPPEPDAPAADAPTADTPAADAPATSTPPRSFGTDLSLSIGAIFLVVSTALWTVAMF